MPQEIEYSAEFEFTDIDRSWKINRSGAVDEWVWVRNLGGFTLTTSSKTPTEVFGSTSLLTYDTLNFGDNPVRKLQETVEYFENTWSLDYTNSIIASPYNPNTANGLKGTMNMQFGGGHTTTQNFAYNCYGIDLLIAVNHATMQARALWLLFRTQNYQAIEKYLQGSANQSEYLSLAQFM